MKHFSQFILFSLLAFFLSLALACGPRVKPEEAPPPQTTLKTPSAEEPTPEPSASSPTKPVRTTFKMEKQTAIPKPVTKPETKPEPKPEPKPEVEPVPKPEPEAKPSTEPPAGEFKTDKSYREHTYWLGFSAGGAKLWGGRWNLSTIGPVGGILIRYQPIGRKLGFGLDLAYARFYCYEDIYEPEAKDYKTDMILAGVTTSYYLMPAKAFSPFVSVHAGITNWTNQMPPVYPGQPMKDWGDPSSNIKGTNIHTGFTLGLRVRVTPAFQAFLEGRAGYMPNRRMNVGHHDANDKTSAVVAGALYGL